MAAHGHGWPGPGTWLGVQWGTSWACQHLRAGSPPSPAGPLPGAPGRNWRAGLGVAPPHPEVPPPQGRQPWSQPRLGTPAHPSPQALPSPWPCTDEARAGVSITSFLTLNPASEDQSCADGPACSPWLTPLRLTRTHGALRASPVCLSFPPSHPICWPLSARGPGRPPSPLEALTLPPAGQQSWSLPHVCSRPQGLPAAPSWGSEALLGATGEIQRGQRPGSHSWAWRAWGRNPGLLCEPYFNYGGEGGGVWLTRLQGTAGPGAGGPPGPGDSAEVRGRGVDRGRILPFLCAFQGDRL